MAFCSEGRKKRIALATTAGSAPTPGDEDLGCGATLAPAPIVNKPVQSSVVAAILARPVRRRGEAARVADPC